VFGGDDTDSDGDEVPRVEEEAAAAGEAQAEAALDVKAEPAPAREPAVKREPSDSRRQQRQQQRQLRPTCVRSAKRHAVLAMGGAGGPRVRVEAEEAAKPKRAPHGDPKLRMPIENSSANGAERNSEFWSKDEDDLLRTIVAEHGGANWKVLATDTCQLLVLNLVPSHEHQLATSPLVQPVYRMMVARWQLTSACAGDCVAPRAQNRNPVL
jgi:hypothetical protein